MNRTIVILASLAVAVAIVVGGNVRTARANTIAVAAGIVEINGVDGLCSLREAIENANDDAATHGDCDAGSGDDRITLPAGLYDLVPGGALPSITTTIEIAGAGSDVTLIDAGAADRAFLVPVTGELRLEDLTVQNGMRLDSGGLAYVNGGVLAFTRVVLSTGDSDANGGAIFNDGGSVTGRACEIGDSTATDVGGGVASAGGTLDFANCTFHDNGAFEGGAIDADGATVDIASVIFQDNAALGGAGIRNAGGSTLTVEDAIFYQNQSIGGAGILNVESSTATVSSSTFAENLAGIGGGIYNGEASTLNLSGSLLRANDADTGAALYNGGAAILNVVNSTISGNIAATNGAVRNEEADSTTNLTNVTIVETGGAALSLGPGLGPSMIVARNVLVAGNSDANCNEGLPTGTTNISDDDSCGPSFTGVFDPRIGPLADNGGPTDTHALLEGSLAIDTGHQLTCNAIDPPYDQRGEGFARTSGTACDVGAFEYQHPAPPPDMYTVYLPILARD